MTSRPSPKPTSSPIRQAAAALSLALASAAGFAAPPADQPAATDIGFVRISPDIALRRLVVHAPNPKGTVLFLHGFPETLYAWKDIAAVLGKDYDVHAFDWPGYGQSSRPPVERFAYGPRDYAKVLRDYIAAAGIDKSRLVICATDIGGLPALLLALDDPAVARRIIVGDFAPFDRPETMYPSLQSLKVKETADATHAAMNRTSDEILANAYRRGLPKEAQFDIPADYAADMAQGWHHGSLSSADAFAHYYAQFTRDQQTLEANLGRLRTPVKVIWGEKDVYIRTDMGMEFAKRIGAELEVLPGVGHYPHLQDARHTVEEVQAAFGPGS